ncbi:MAG: hypothetical protein COB02_09610 [Candidatus Cloacimonadota bacterium]|nr:MAG: hypothetical protein COB02_09610 [Candidatus Cloacimonadota bacterium]
MKLKLKNHDTEEDLKKAIKSTKNVRYQLRLRTILMLKQGFSPSDIKKALLISPTTYGNYIYKYNEGGKKNLEKYGSGRKEGNQIWDLEIFVELFKKIDCMEEYWSVVKMQEWIKENYGKNIPSSTIEYNLHKANYSWKSNRPSPYKGDEEKQKEFKKKVLKRWLKN